MQHSFDVDIAKEQGILEAILLNNLWFWIEKNKANNTNFFDGYYWTYNSTKAFNELFPYVTQRQIQNALKKLKEREIIQTGNYNKSAYDRTLWYAFTKKGECIMQKCKMENVNLLNGLGDNVEPIPYINTNDKPNDKPNKKESKTFDDLIETFTEDKEIRDLLKDWLKVRKAKRAAMTNRAIELNLKKLHNLADESKMGVVEYLEEVISRGWAAFYKINNFNKPNASNTYKRQEIVPDWLHKGVEENEATEEEIRALEEKLNQKPFEERKVELQERLKNKYKKD